VAAPMRVLAGAHGVNRRRRKEGWRPDTGNMTCVGNGMKTGGRHASSDAVSNKTVKEEAGMHYGTVPLRYYR